MKTLPDNSLRQPPVLAMTAHAFTLTEMMVTMAVFSMVMIVMVSLQIFGLKMNTFTSNKLKSTAYSLKALNQVRDQVRGATQINVGNGSGASFTATGTNGNALQIYLTTNLNNYVRIYLDTNTTKLYRLDKDGLNTNSSVIASNIVNPVVFQREDYRGSNIASSDAERACTIKMTLQFSQSAFFTESNYYSLQTLMTPRVQ